MWVYNKNRRRTPKEPIYCVWVNAHNRRRTLKSLLIHVVRLELTWNLHFPIVTKSWNSWVCGMYSKGYYSNFSIWMKGYYQVLRLLRLIKASLDVTSPRGINIGSWKPTAPEATLQQTHLCESKAPPTDVFHSRFATNCLHMGRQG